MATKNQLLTTSEFASQAGIASAKVSKLIRNGKIKAEKKSGKWMIGTDQLNTKAVTAASKPGKPAAKKKAAKPKPKKAAVPKADKPAATTKSFSIAEFAGMTYLTENGVMQWLQQGLLKGQQSAGGDWQIEASNLKVPNVKRLVR